MMKKFLLALAGFIIISNYSFSQFTLRIQITNLRNNTGKVMLQVFNEKEKVIDQEMGDIKDESSLFTINNLPAGKYAVRFYHDENMNQTMEKNLVGKPTEGYGFSNNVTGRFSMPPFEKWIFPLDEDKKIIIKAVY
jgi:uncharacterized protein (DUF2141 family)